MSGSSGSGNRFPAALFADIHVKRQNPQTYVPGQFVTASDLLDLGDIDSSGTWHQPVIAVHFVCSWGVPESAEYPYIPSQLASYGSSGPPSTHGPVGQLTSRGAHVPPGRVTVPPAWFSQMQMQMQMPPMQLSAYPQTAGAQTQMPMQPPYPGASTLMPHPSQLYGQTQYGQTQAMYGQASVTYGQAQGTFGQAQGTFGQAQGTLGQAQGTLGQAQGLLVQTTYPSQAMSGNNLQTHMLSQGGFSAAPQAMTMGMAAFGAQSPAAGPPTDRPVAFHLRLFFEFASGQSSIELHQRSSGMADNKAVATFRQYVVTTNNVFDRVTVRSANGNGFTMAQVDQTVFKEKKRHLYRFVNGTGCAYWALKVIGDLENANLLETGARARCTEEYHKWAVRRRKEDELPYHPAKGEWLPV